MGLTFDLLLLPVGSGPIPEVLQYRANPWRWRSKPLSHRPVPKISLISKRCMHRVSDIKLIRTDTFFFFFFFFFFFLLLKDSKNTSKFTPTSHCQIMGPMLQRPLGQHAAPDKCLRRKLPTVTAASKYQIRVKTHWDQKRQSWVKTCPTWVSGLGQRLDPPWVALPLGR